MTDEAETEEPHSRRTIADQPIADDHRHDDLDDQTIAP